MPVRRSFSEGRSVFRPGAVRSLTGLIDPPCDLMVPDAAASTASRSNVRDDRERPSVGRDGENIQVILFRKNRNIFAKGTGHATIRRRVRDKVICPSGKISSQVFIIIRLSAAQSARLRASSCCKKVFADSVRLRLVQYEHAPGARSGTVDGKARQWRSTSCHCGIAGRIVRLPQHRCLPRKASARRGL